MMAARPQVRLAVVGVTAIAALGVLAASGLDDSLVYYRTPSEVAQLAQDDGERIRLGGLVQPGSVVAEGGHTRFTVTDGAHKIQVLHRGDPPGVFQEGQGALVEGSFDDEGVFRSDVLIVKHSNEYGGEDGGKDGGTYQPPAQTTRVTRP